MNDAHAQPTTARPPAAPRGRGRVLTVAALAIAAALVVVVGLRVRQALQKKARVAADRASAQLLAAQRPPVLVTAPAPTTFKPAVLVTGTLQPWRSAAIGFEQSGRLASVLVTAGDTVRSGQALAFLDTSMATAQVGGAEAATRAAEANLALAEDGLKRAEPLAASKSISEAQAEQARQQVALARAQLEGARAQERLARTGAGQRSIAAPFAGVVTRAPTAAGAVVMPGAPLVQIEDHGRFRLSVTLAEEDADVVRPGAIAQIRTRDRVVTGTVTTVVPSLDQATRRAPAEIEVPSDPKEPLLAWSFVHVSIAGGKEVPALSFPESARRAGSQDEIFVLRDGRAKLLHVDHEVAGGAWVVRRAAAGDGAAPGEVRATDLVILQPDTDLKDGDPVDKTQRR